MTELVDGVDRAADTGVCVEQGHKFGALEDRDIFAVVVELEQNLEGSAVAGCLELAPETALVTANTVHQTANVAEAVTEVLLQRRSLTVHKHEGLVKDLGNTGSSLSDLKNLGTSGRISRGVASAEGVVVGLKVWADLGNSAGHERIVKVDVANAVGELVKTVFVAGNVGVPVACGLVQEVVAQVGADAGVHSRHDAVKDTLLKTLIVDLEAGVCNKWSVGVLLALLLELGLTSSCIENLLEVLGGRARLPLGGAEIGRLGERALLEAVLTVDGIPDLRGAGASISSESFGVSDQAHVVALGACALILGDAKVSLVAFVIVFENAALANALAKFSLERSLRMLVMGLLARMLGARTLELAQRVGAPDLRDILLVVQGLDGASDISAHSIFVVPKGTLLVEEVYSVVGEEVGVVGEVVDGGFDSSIELVEGRKRGAGIADNRFGRDLLENKVSKPRTKGWTLRGLMGGKHDLHDSRPRNSRKNLERPKGQTQRDRITCLQTS